MSPPRPRDSTSEPHNCRLSGGGHSADVPIQYGYHTDQMTQHATSTAVSIGLRSLHISYRSLHSPPFATHMSFSTCWRHESQRRSTGPRLRRLEKLRGLLRIPPHCFVELCRSANDLHPCLLEGPPHRASSKCPTNGLGRRVQPRPSIPPGITLKPATDER